MPPASTSPSPEPRSLAMFAGHTGAAVDWSQVRKAIEWADVVIVGEEHDDAMGHAVQRAIVEDVTSACPGSCCALSMEMLERDEQPLVDDYLEGLIDAATLEKLTLSENWGADGGWKKWYGPIVEAAKSNGARVVAANAPRRYVRLARSRGYDMLRQLPRERRRHFAFPREVNDVDYKARFFEVMRAGGGQAATQPATQPGPSTTTAPASQPSTAPATTAPESQPSTAPATMPADHGDDEPTPAQIGATYRSQSMWDATMADSIAKARRSGARKVIHLVGAFHCDFEGGTVLQLRSRSPGVRVIVISMHKGESATLLEEDRGRGDVVIYTGKPAPKDSPPPATAPATPN